MSSNVNVGRPRSNVSREAIFSATYAMLEEVGFDKLSIEGIAARAGVGKATIYRWWPNKGVLAMDAFLRTVAPSIEFPSTGSARSDMTTQIRAVAKAYRSKAGRIVREVIGLGQSDAHTMKLFIDGYLEPRRSAAKEVLARGIRQGEFRSTIDLDVIVDALYAPIFHRLLTGHAPIDDRYVNAYIELIFDGIANDRATRKS